MEHIVEAAPYSGIYQWAKENKTSDLTVLIYSTRIIIAIKNSLKYVFLVIEVIHPYSQ
jgi:hypothetical protein